MQNGKMKIKVLIKIIGLKQLLVVMIEIQQQQQQIRLIDHLLAMRIIYNHQRITLNVLIHNHYRNVILIMTNLKQQAKVL